MEATNLTKQELRDFLDVKESWAEHLQGLNGGSGDKGSKKVVLLVDKGTVKIMCVDSVDVKNIKYVHDITVLMLRWLDGRKTKEETVSAMHEASTWWVQEKLDDGTKGAWSKVPWMPR